jgi:predicted permease
MQEIFYNILPLFLIALLGNMIKRIWLKSSEFWRGLEKLSFYILFPTVLFEHSWKIDLTELNFTSLITGLIIANAIISTLLVIYQYKYNFDKIQFTSVFQGATRYNNYILFSVGSAILGEKGLSIIASISPYLLIFTNMTSVIVFYCYGPRGDSLDFRKGVVLLLKSIIVNPFILASLTGFGFNYFNIKLNLGIYNTIDILANAAFAIGMLIVGASIKLTFDPVYSRQILATSTVKLVLMPVVTYIILYLMSVSGLARSVGVLLSALPCASSSYILSRQLGGDPNTMSATITFSTIFSILSLSIVVCILG